MRKILGILWFLFLSLGLVQAQQTVITGKVKDARDGLPLSGVTVRVKGNPAGVQTEIDGSFRIQVAGKQNVLVFSYVGYAPEEVNVGSKNADISVLLSTEDRKLQEVVVVAYGSQDKSKITGSIGKVDGKELKDIPMTSVDQMLQGKVAGLQSVAPTGQPGGLQQIRIRGIGSIYASSEPLYVIDGVPINSGDFSRNSTTSNALAGINPNDIESVSVLKDASAASLYGSRAANGVILITTKKGRAGKTRIGFDAEYGWSNVAYLNSEAKPLNAAQYTELTTEGLVNAGLTASQATDYLNNVLNANNGYNTNWLDEVTRQGISQQYNLSASGGDSKTTFYASGGYFKQEGVVIGADFSRYTGSVSLTHHVTEKISLGFSVNAAHYDQNTPNQSAAFRSPVLAAFYLLPFQHPYNKDGSYDYSPSDYEQIYNPLAIVHYDKQLLSNTKLLGTISGDYHILNNLKFSTRLGLDYFTLEELLYYNPFFGDAVTRGGDMNNYYTRVFNWVWTNTLDYHLDMDKEGNLTADLKLGYESQKSKEYDISAYGSGVPGVTSLILPPTSTPKLANGTGSDYSFASLFSNLQLNYKNKFSVSGSLRRDGSSRFGSNDRYGTFWSVGGAWNIDKEQFMDNAHFLSSLKLRASYGVNGNAGGGNVTSSTGTSPTTPGFGNYTWRPLYGFGVDNAGFSTNYNQSPGGAPFQVGNENLTWELNKPFDVGAEVGVFKNRLTVEFDYYYRKTSRLLQSVPLSLTSGFGSYPANIGSMENKGVEFTVNATPVLTKDFRWDLSFNIAINHNKVLALENNQDIIVGNPPQIIRVGQDIQSVYTFIWAGVDPQTGSGLWYTDGTKKSTTSDVTKVQNAIIGSNSPRGFGGFLTNFTYKGITLSAQFNFQYGNLVYDQWGFLNQSDGAFFTLNQNQLELKRWQKPGDKTNEPQYVAGNQSQSNTTSSRYFYKGDYIRLRNLTLSYQFPRNLLKSVRADNCMIYLRGTNLWTKAFDKNLTFDPEQPINGTNDLQILLQKTFSIGLNLNF
jgi:TonB-linked SusC/RagA family outer membrane protein